ncbi:MAG: hypothetical protein FWD61_08580 [Phycisphaerales bacterium]|nr:hypothetical protein [Phycisphaerales bacterium]
MTRSFQKSPASRVQRFARRHAFWLIFFVALAAIAIWRYQGSQPLRPQCPTVPLPKLPPLADKPVRLHADNTPLADVLRDLSQQAGIPFNIDWPTLRQDGHSENYLVSEETGNEPIPLSAALSALLINLAADYTTTPLFISNAYVIEGEAVEGKSRAIVATYPVGDLLVIRDPWTVRPSNSRDYQLINMINGYCLHDIQWRLRGDQWPAPSVTLDNDLLTVRASANRHYMIRQFLASLRMK